MDKIELNKEKIKSYAKIQSLILGLAPNSTDEEISSLIKQIPPEFLSQKEDLMMICQLIAQYARNFSNKTKRNAIKLMEQIMPQIKSLLSTESIFFFSIFGGLFYIKLWLYQEGVISIDQIICLIFDSDKQFEYFLPEIIEKAPELFEKEAKRKIKFDYSPESLHKLVELRKKHFEWLRNSNDYYDSSYREIEKNKLRLAIKMDDIDTFQQILSQSNMSINSKIQESTLENFNNHDEEMSLIHFAIYFNSINIIKFLIMHEAKIEDKAELCKDVSRNVEIFHMLEGKVKNAFMKLGLQISISTWNNELTEYLIDNYDFGYIEESNIDPKYDKDIISIFGQSIYSCDFIFWENKLLPFLNKNPDFIKRNISHLIMETLNDSTCFFIKTFLKYPGININFTNEREHSYLTYAISLNNINGLKLILKNPDIDINQQAYNGFSAFQLACYTYRNVDILKALSSIPSFDINKIHPENEFNAFALAAYVKNFIALKYIINHFPTNKLMFPYLLLYFCISDNSYYCLEIILNYLIEQENPRKKEILTNFKKICEFTEDDTDEIYNNFSQYINEFMGKDDNEDNDESDYYDEYEYSDVDKKVKVGLGNE